MASVHIKRRLRRCDGSSSSALQAGPGTPACASQPTTSITKATRLEWTGMNLSRQKRRSKQASRQAGIQQIVAPGEFTTFSHEPQPTTSPPYTHSGVLRFGLWFRPHHIASQLDERAGERATNWFHHQDMTCCSTTVN